MSLFGDGPTIKPSRRRSKLEELMDEKRRILSEGKGRPEENPAYSPLSSSSRIEISTDSIGQAVNEAATHQEEIRSEWNDAETYRRALERELEATRGAVSERVLDLKDELAKARVQIRDRDERIALLLERIERNETDGTSEARTLRTQMEDLSSRYERTLADHRDLFQTCENELIAEHAKTRELAAEIQRLKREIQGQVNSNQTTLNLFERSEKQYVESEKERLQLRLRVQDLERTVSELEKQGRVTASVTESITELYASLESLESFFDFAQTKGTTPHTFKAGQAILVVLRDTLRELQSQIRP